MVKNDSQLAAPCIACGRPSAPHGEHHAIERGDGATKSKGMGGSKLNHEHQRIVLCRADHQAVHDKLLDVRRKGDFYLLTKDGVTWSRAQQEVPIAATQSLLAGPQQADLWEALRRADDASLCSLWAETDREAAKVVLARALVAAEFQQRYRVFGDRWYVRVSEMIHDQEGISVSNASIYNYAGIGAALMRIDDPLAAVERLGNTVLAATGKAILAGVDAEQAIEYAEAKVDNGERKTRIARDVKEVLQGKTPRPKCRDTKVHVCRYCGDELEEVK